MDDLLEQTISHYRIVSLLGEGGMGVVYRAYDARLDRDLALKVLPPGAMADETARTRLLDEARTASSLSHPHIAVIYDVGEDRGHMFFAMELVLGKSLRDVIPRGGLPLSTVCEYGAQIASALAFAHERGVIHRDLKTANVMITPEGRVKVLDFGLAKRLKDAKDGNREETDPGLTASGTILGTPNYLPPEVLLGGSADARSDIWALGVVLYEMASGKLPFEGASVPELAGAIVNRSPNPLTARVPTGLQLVIARCLAKDPNTRYRSASEVQAALEALDPSLIRTGGGARRVWLMTGGVVLVVALAVALALRTGDIQKWIAGAGGDAAAGDRPHIGSLAVLPLANLSGDPSQEYFADGMTDELITKLAPIRSLKVISRTSVLPFKGSKKSLKEIAAALDVDAIVEGSVLRAGDKVRITAQLIEAAEDRHLWAKSYEREVKDVLGLQSEVARDIAGEIQLRLSPQEMVRMTQGKTMNPAAYELYLKGRYEWSKVSPEGVAKAIEYYKRALALDPGDARYSAGLADAYLLQTQVISTLPQKEGMAKVKEYARRALAADDSSAEAHASMAVATLFADWNWPEAERHVLHAIQLNPGYSTAHLVYSVILATSGRINEAIEQDALATSLDPLSLVVNWHAAGTLFYARRYDEAIAQAKRAVELDPSSPLPQGSLAHIYEQIGDYKSSLDILERHLPESMGGKAVVAKLRQAYAAGGASAYWRTILALHKEGGTGPAADPIHLAMIDAKLGDRDKAIAMLERAFAQHLGDMIFINVEPCFDPLRSDPRFKALVRRVGLQPSA